MSRNQFQDSEKGFTLVELLVVTSIIGVLASIAIVSFAEYKENTYEAAGIVMVKHVVTEMEAYLADGNFTAGLNATLKNHNGVITEEGDYDTLIPNMRVGEQTLVNAVTSYACDEPNHYAYWLHVAQYQSTVMVRYWKGCNETGYFYTNQKNPGSYW